MLITTKKSIVCSLVIIAIMILSSCQTTSKSLDKDSDIKLLPLAYNLGFFPIPKYYDLDKKVKKLVVIKAQFEEGVKKQIQDELIRVLWSLPTVKLIEREQMKELLKEQEMGALGVISSESAMEIGKLLGADHIFTYSIETCANNEETYRSYNIWGKINARIYNAQTGEIVFWSSSITNGIGANPQVVKKFWYAYTRAVTFYAFWAFTESLHLAFGQSSLGVLYNPTKLTYVLPGPQVSYTWVNSPAYKAGIEPKDVIVEADGKKVATQGQLENILNTHNPNLPMEIKIIRKEKDKTLYINFR